MGDEVGLRVFYDRQDGGKPAETVAAAEPKALESPVLPGRLSAPGAPGAASPLRGASGTAAGSAPPALQVPRALRAAGLRPEGPASPASGRLRASNEEAGVDWDAVAERIADPDEGARALEEVSQLLLDEPSNAQARRALHKGLTKLSMATEEDKFRLVGGLKKPAGIVVPIASSLAPHTVEAHIMLDRLDVLLREEGRGVSGWMEANKAGGLAGMFYLRANAYDRLHTYLKSHPEEAAPVAKEVFSDLSSIEPHAWAIQALADRLTGGQATPQVRKAFLEGALEALDGLPKERARKLALLLELYKDRYWQEGERIEAATAPHLPEDFTLPAAGQPPYGRWPQGTFRASFHFAEAKVYGRSLKFFESKGYRVSGAQDRSAVLVKKAGEVEVTLHLRAYEADEEGYLAGGEKARFIEAVGSDLQDPTVQGVFMRAHAQFSGLKPFFEGAAPAKLFFDGTCRGVWHFSQVAPRCEDCAFIGNVGGGASTVNDTAGYEILEGLARREDWPAIGARIKSALPGGAGRFLGPWVPSYQSLLAPKVSP